MKIIAWSVLGIVALQILWQPVLWGGKRGTYGAVTFYDAILSAALMVPICGRVLGWW